jgi:HEAT repeat protein
MADLDPTPFGAQAQALLADEAPEVRRAALVMAATLADEQLWPAVIQAGATPGTARLAGRALAAGGPSALPAIEATLARPDLPQRQDVALVNACGRIGGEHAVQLLTDRLGHPDPEVRAAVLEALSASGYRAALDDLLRALGRAEVAEAAWTAATLVDLGTDAEVRPLQRALDLSMQQVAGRLCLWLSFVADAPMLLRARRALAQGQGAQRAYALELLDTQLPNDLKSLVLPLAEDLSPHQRLRRLADAFPQERQSPADRLNAILSGPAARWCSRRT